MASERDEIFELLSGKVRELIKLVAETDITELRIERGDLKLRISKGLGDTNTSAQSREDGEHPDDVVSSQEDSYIQAPLVGRFYRAAPGQNPLVGVGDTLARGQKVCVVESMKMLHDIESEHEGQVEEILCEDGQAVEYGQPLFRVRLAVPLNPSGA